MVPDPTLKAPEPSLLSELSAVRELSRLPRFWMTLKRMPRGAARVVVAPGFLTSDRSTWVLRRALSALGHEVTGWGLGRNHGRVRKLIAGLSDQVSAAASEGPVHLIGWSLGGYIAREVARGMPDQIAQVITLASPVVGGPKYTAAAKWYRERGVDLDALEQEVAAREAVPLRVPVTALYSPVDQVVCPAACIDHHSPQVDHISVACSHAGFGFSPEVFTLLAERLAQPPARWSVSEV